MADRVLHEGRFLALRERDGWEFVQRTRASAVVMIAACTDADEVVLIEQLRPPLGTTVIEMPAGLVGDEDADEALVDAARRELIEETGFDAERWETFGQGPPSAGLSDEVVTILRAGGLRRVGAGGGVDNEAISVHLVPRRQVDDWLNEAMRRGRLVDAKVWAGLYALARA